MLQLHKYVLGYSVTLFVVTALVIKLEMYLFIIHERGQQLKRVGEIPPVGL